MWARGQATNDVGDGDDVGDTDGDDVTGVGTDIGDIDSMPGDGDTDGDSDSDVGDGDTDDGDVVVYENRFP